MAKAGKTLSAAAVLVCLAAMSLWPATASGKGTQTSVNIGFETFEPTIAGTANGDLYFSTTPESGVAVGWKASIARSTDAGKTWKDVGPTLPSGHSNPPETNDPYIYADPATGRVFTFHMGPILTCSILSFSDDAGKTWFTNPKGCSPTAVWDHQTIVAAKPRSTPTVGYPNILHQCVNAIYAAMCATSVDGGLTWGPSVPAYVNEGPGQTGEACGAQHGHLTNGPDGKVYLPTSACGTYPTVYITEDDGLSWRKSVIAEMPTPFVDPSVSVDSKGNLYAVFIDERGFLHYATSRNDGQKWSKPVTLAEGYTANMPVIVAGDPGKVVVAYPATNDLPKGYDTKDYLDGPAADLIKKVSWGANMTVSLNGLDQNPTFRTTVTTGNDPIGRGRICTRATRCEYLIDFIEAVIGADGHPYASFVDGCVDECAVKSSGPQIGGTGQGLLATLPDVKLCAALCWRYKSGASEGPFDLARAMEHATSREAWASSLEHSHLSPKMRDLMTEAAESRIEAIFGR